MTCSLISHHIGNKIIGWKYTRLWDFPPYNIIIVKVTIIMSERGRVHTHSCTVQDDHRLYYIGYITTESTQ